MIRLGYLVSAWAYYKIPNFYMEGLTLNLTEHYQILKPYLLGFSLDFKFLCSEIGEKCDLNYQVFKILSQISRLFWSQGSRSRPKSNLLCLSALAIFLREAISLISWPLSTSTSKRLFGTMVIVSSSHSRLPDKLQLNVLHM